MPNGTRQRISSIGSIHELSCYSTMLSTIQHSLLPHSIEKWLAEAEDRILAMEEQQLRYDRKLLIKLVCLSACLSACLPACLPSCLPSCLPACLPVNMSTCSRIDSVKAYHIHMKYLLNPPFPTILSVAVWQPQKSSS